MPNSAWQFPHRRFDALRRQWVLVSPHRTERPWQGEVNTSSGFPDIHYDPKCYLCPGNERAGGKHNPKYEGVFTFDNDYAALLPDSPDPGKVSQPALLVAERERGRCRVICFHPDHGLTLARMEAGDIRKVVDEWTAQYESLGSDPTIGYVQIFENRGAMMGASNPHPHCQIWATEHIPDAPAVESESLAAYHQEHGSCLLCDYVATEAADGARTVCENEDFLVVVPWWAVWPFETLVLAKQHVGALPGFSDRQRSSLAAILKQTTTRYDNLFETSFPYTMGFHQSPTDGEEHAEWHFHGHFYPPLLRSATVKKFMVGFEMLGMPQRDITPESAAERLRTLPDLHFTLR